MHYVFDFGAIFQGEYPDWLLRGFLTTLALAALAWSLAFWSAACWPCSG